MTKWADQDWARHLADNAPSQRCSGCGRHTWTPREFGQACGMTQPNGSRCSGSFTAPPNVVWYGDRMSTRTSPAVQSLRDFDGTLAIRDSHGYNRELAIVAEPGGITIMNTDHGVSQRTYVHLDTAGLDQLAAEIRRIREERGY